MKQRPLRWMRLDNAAKIYPANRRRKWSNVFRLSATLQEPIDPIVLQSALDVTIHRFPSIAGRLRRGMFWYYLEESDFLPIIEEEQEPLCAALYEKNRPGLLFRVTYFGPRINLEVYHVLADGTGAMWFLEEMVCRYLSLSHPQLRDKWRKEECAPPIFRRQEDSYSAHYGKTGCCGHRRLQGDRTGHGGTAVAGRLPGLWDQPWGRPVGKRLLAAL